MVYYLVGLAGCISEIGKCFLSVGEYVRITIASVVKLFFLKHSSPVPFWACSHLCAFKKETWHSYCKELAKDHLHANLQRYAVAKGSSEGDVG